MPVELLDRYQILRRPNGEQWEIARNAHSVTYKATDQTLYRTVALTLLNAGVFSDDRAREQFWQTVRAFMNLEHEGVGQLLDAGEVGDEIFYTTKYYAAQSLADRVGNQGALPWKEALRVTDAVCGAFAAALATSRTVPGGCDAIHSDFSPTHVLLTVPQERPSPNTIVKVVGFDFVCEPNSPRTVASAIRALGATLQFMLGGAAVEPPVNQSNAEQVRRVQSRIGAQPEIPGEVVALLERMLHADERAGVLAFETLHRRIAAIVAEWERPLVVGNSDSAGDASDEDFDVGTSATLSENLQFTAYRPKVVQPGKWNKMLVFAHLDERPEWMDEDERAPIEEMEAQARQILGDRINEYRNSTADSVLAIPRNGEITLVPEIAGFEFNPPRRSFIWTDGVSVHDETFSLRAANSLDGQVARGRLTIFLGHLILAEITLAIRVDSTYMSPTHPASSHVPREQSSARAFRRVFASYSHSDIGVVTAMEVHARALGDEYLRDWVNLRSGELWNDRLMAMISEADVFQLFWSHNAAASRYVAQEWQYALGLGRNAFVRPTYWQDPMPAPPELLQGIHFHRLTAAVSPSATPIQSTPIRSTPIGVRPSASTPPSAWVPPSVARPATPPVRASVSGSSGDLGEGGASNKVWMWVAIVVVVLTIVYFVFK